MSNSIITFFPVGDKNGGMTLLRLNDSYQTTILVDVCIGDAPIADHCDVAQEFRDRLPKDSIGRPYVDAFILTHRHQDHLQGIQTHFHLGPISQYVESKEGEDPKIIIRELWSNYHFWKRSSPDYELCDDAKVFNAEMKRRVELFKGTKSIQAEGERAIIVGKDPDGKHVGLEDITREIGSNFVMINNRDLSSKFKGNILGPLYRQPDEEDDVFNDKNRQSVILQMVVNENGFKNQILLAADAECFIWETLWSLYKNNTGVLEYDILQAPHHCSWHSLSYDSQSECENSQVCSNAKAALSQKKTGASIVSQSKVISDDDDNPPSVAAKDEYLKIVPKARFYCTNEYPNENKPEPLEFNLTGSGPQLISPKEKSKLSVAALASTRESYPHG